MSGRTAIQILTAVAILSFLSPLGLGTSSDIGRTDEGGTYTKPVPFDAIPWGSMGPLPSMSDNLSPEQCAIKSITEEVEIGNLYRYVSSLQGFGSRLYRAPGMYQATEWLADLLVGNGNFTVTYHNITLDRGTLGIYHVSSIILTLPGLNTSSDTVHYMFAHDDSVQQNDYNALLTDSPGADDDASGCAAVIEAARVLGRHRFQDTIRFAFFNAEEIGLIGSEYWAQNMSARGEKVGGFIDYDMIGYCTGSAEYELDLYYGPSSAQLTSKMIESNDRYGIDLKVLPYLTTSMIPSDIQSFYDHGFQGVMGIEEEFNPFYHTTSDTVEKLNFTLVRKSTQLAVATLAEWSRLIYVDVTVPKDGLELSPTDPSEGEDVTVSVTVNDTGNLDADDLEVAFYCDGIEFDRTTMDVKANSTSKTSAAWRAFAGYHNISVRLDPDDLLIESDETNNTASAIIAVNDIPVASMVPSSSSVRTYEMITFDASLSKDLVHGVKDHSFDLGDGNSSGWTEDPTFEWSYVQDGTYTVTLVVRDRMGALSEPVMVDVEVLNRPPLAHPSSNVRRAFTLAPILFTSGASDADGSISCSWDFGDGTFSGENDPVHAYLRMGTYEVRLNVTDDDMTTSSYSLAIDIEGWAPTATIDMGSYEGDIRTELLFKANATDIDGTISSYLWDLGDGSSSAEPSFYHSYPHPGRFEVLLTVRDNDGLMASHSVNINIRNTAPVARGSSYPSEVLTGEPVEFDGSASSDLEGNVTCIWDLGDGNSSIGGLVHHMYDRPGTYYPVLRVVDMYQSEDILELPPVIVLNSPPYVHFTIYGHYLVNSTLVFDASFSRDRDGGLTFDWDFGDGEKGSGMVISHTFTGPGNYTVTLNLSDLQGAHNEMGTTIWIKEVPSDDGPPPDDEEGEAGVDDSLMKVVLILFISNTVTALVAVVAILLLFRSRKGPNNAQDFEM